MSWCLGDRDKYGPLCWVVLREEAGDSARHAGDQGVTRGAMKTRRTSGHKCCLSVCLPALVRAKVRQVREHVKLTASGQTRHVAHQL